MNVAGLLLLWFYLCLYQSFTLASGTAKAYFDSKVRLMKYLTNDSEFVKEIRPAKDNNSAVNVTIRIHLHEIGDVDEKHQLIQTTFWLTFAWNNPFLTWDPAEYGGIESVHADHEVFWVPDVALYNEARLDEKILYKRLETKLVVNKDGDCRWDAPATLLSQCKMDLAQFPFDKQECYLTFGSWTYQKHKFNIAYFERHADLSHYKENGIWDIESALLKNKLEYYDPYNEAFSDVTLTLKIKRRPLYYCKYIVGPSALISTLASFSFILPSGYGERITLLTGVLVANSVYVLSVSSMLPETSDAVPILGTYLLGNMIVIVFCLWVTCVSLKFHSLSCPMCSWMWKLVQCLEYIKRVLTMCILCTCGEGKNEEANMPNKDKAMYNNANETCTIELKERPIQPKDKGSKSEDTKSSTKEELAEKWKTASRLIDNILFIASFFAFAIRLMEFYANNWTACIS